MIRGYSEENDDTITGYDVNDTRRETGFVDKVCKFECSQGRDLRRLINYRKGESQGKRSCGKVSSDL